MARAPVGPRCVALIGPYLSGKTTLLESILAVAGAIPRKGSVKDGTSVGDASPEARAHQMSTSVTVAGATFMDEAWSFLDCPGSIEFGQDAMNALTVADAAVVVTEPAADRVQMLEPILRFLDDRAIPHFLFINKIDTLNGRIADYLGALQAYSKRPLLLRQVPIREGDAVTGYVDLVSQRAYRYVPGKASDLISVPTGVEPRKEEARRELLEHLADFDDKLMEQLLEDVVPKPNEIYAQLSKDLGQDLIVPVLLGSAERDHGVRRLLKALRHEVPGVAATAERLGVTTKDTAEPVLQVFKTVHQGHLGRLSVARVWRGEVKDGMTLGGARPSGLFLLTGEQAAKVPAARAGDVVALGRMESVRTGDFITLSGAPVEVLVEPPPPLPPVAAQAISAKNRNDEVKLSSALHKLLAEDPSLAMEHPSDAGEMLLKGQGDIHLKVAIERLASRFNVEVVGRPPATPYKETIRKGTAQHARYKRQTGGHGQFADVKLDIKPLPRGSGFQFSEVVVGGAVPRNFIPAVEEGAREATQRGPLGFPVVDVEVTLTDGQFHAVDSSEMSFKTAGRQGVHEALPKCDPVILEPILKVTVYTPKDATSKVQRVVTGRRAQILGFDTREGWDSWERIDAYMPQSEIGDLIVELRSLS
ncbi:MAG: elongation factor G, partial [Alphaproteobacteria bacterium]|nr:elongation factor G [Alphaproteobacteria bacterium]